MAKVFDPPKQIKPPAFNMDTYKADEAKFIKELKDFVTKRKPGKNVGEIVRFSVADGNAEYMIASMSPLELVHIPLGDAYHYQHIGRLKVKDIEAQLGMDNFWSNMKKKDKAEWFNCLKKQDLKPGDIVHDKCNKDFAIRCELQADGSLKDIGIVGEVKQNDMPKIYIGGDKPKVHYGYYIERVHKGESKIWDNRIAEFPELSGDFSLRSQPLNKEAMTKLEITPEILTKHNRFNAANEALNAFQYGNVSFDELKQLINNIK